MLRQLLATFIIYCISILLCYAQENADTVYFFTGDQRIIMGEILSNTFSHRSRQRSFGVLDLHYRSSEGNLRQAQQAYSAQDIVFQAKGFNRIGNFRIAGIFTFNNNQDDSLANGQRNNIEELTPFYAHANKSTDYRRQNYLMQALGSYDISTYWRTGLGLHYHKHWSAGTSDPRLRTDRFILKLQPTVSYSFGNNSIGVYGKWGKADEDVRFSYKNLNYQRSTLYPDRLIYVNWGYGNTSLRDTTNVFKYDSYSGFGAEYALENSLWKIRSFVDHELFINDNYFQRPASTRSRGVIGRFTMSTLRAGLDIYKQDDAHDNQHFLSFSAQTDDGYDGNIVTTGSLDIVNYKVSRSILNLEYLYLWDKKASNSKEIGIDISRHYLSREDLSQSIRLKSDNYLFNLRGKWYADLNKNYSYIVGAEVFLGIPTSNTELSYSALSKTEFLRNIVFTDYYFYSSSFYGTRLQGEYVVNRFAGQNRLGFFARIDLSKQNPLDLRADLDPTFIPSGQRMEWQMGARMYLFRAD